VGADADADAGGMRAGGRQMEDLEDDSVSASASASASFARARAARARRSLQRAASLTAAFPSLLNRARAPHPAQFIKEDPAGDDAGSIGPDHHEPGGSAAAPDEEASDAF
jgi:hypothetical protein